MSKKLNNTKLTSTSAFGNWGVYIYILVNNRIIGEKSNASA